MLLLVALIAISMQSGAPAAGARYSVTLTPDPNVASAETIIRFLLDAKRMRTLFLREAVEQLRLGNAAVVCERVEALAKQKHSLRW